VELYDFSNNLAATNRTRETFARTATGMLSGIDLFQVAGDRMRYLTERQTLIARNIVEPDAVGSQQPVDTEADYGGEKPTGNTVSVEEQMIKSADISNAFAMATAVYTKSISIMKTAVDYGR
jgi:flagellar basal-body rod protein FlgB